MTITAKVVEDSLAPNGTRLTTLQLVYPRFIHAELMTHRVFSRNASSSRAIPVAKMIEQVRTNPAMPIHWGKNQPGMQAMEELGDGHKEAAKRVWLDAAQDAADNAERMLGFGAHKQVINRILEPFQHIHVILSSTTFSNWDSLRDHADAEPNIQVLAHEIKRQMYMSAPVKRPRDKQNAASWHLPFVTAEERFIFADKPEFLAKLSVARSARVSYLTHDGRVPNIDEDLALYDRLVGSVPLHASPTEHQAYPLPLATQKSNNLTGWRQHRELVEFAAYQ